MSEHHFLLNIDRAGVTGIEPQARMWIDDQQTSDLCSEREVSLVRETRSTWAAKFSAERPFIYRIGIVAAPGSRWSLVFRAGEDQEELQFDSDELAMTKEWLIGTCDTLDASPQRASHESLLALHTVG